MTPDNACRDTYQGDAALKGLLAKAGAQIDADGVRDILRGVLAAPEPASDPEAWMALVAPGASPALAAQLRALKRAVEGEREAAAPPGRAKRLADLRAEVQRRRQRRRQSDAAVAVPRMAQAHGREKQRQSGARHDVLDGQRRFHAAPMGAPPHGRAVRLHVCDVLSRRVIDRRDAHGVQASVAQVLVDAAQRALVVDE